MGDRVAQISLLCRAVCAAAIAADDWGRSQPWLGYVAEVTTDGERQLVPSRFTLPEGFWDDVEPPDGLRALIEAARSHSGPEPVSGEDDDSEFVGVILQIEALVDGTTSDASLLGLLKSDEPDVDVELTASEAKLVLAVDTEQRRYYVCHRRGAPTPDQVALLGQWDLAPLLDDLLDALREVA